MATTKGKVGRPSKLNDTVRKAIVQAVSHGAVFETAAAFAGVERVTFRAWLTRGRKEIAEDKLDTPHALLVIELEKALADCEVMWLTAVGGAAVDHWKAAAWLLERKWPERYGRRWQIAPEHSEDGQPISDEQLADMTDEQLDALIETVAKVVSSKSIPDVVPA